MAKFRTTSRSRRKRVSAPPGRFPNIQSLIRAGGDIQIGRMANVECAAVAADECQTLAMLARSDDESFEDLLARLDAAIGAFWETDEAIDEING